MSEQKYIALIDCDSFFVSCERTFNENLNNKAVCVVSGDRGCVVARSKEAKQMGIPMGLPLFMAKEQFPQCIYINANHCNYLKISKEIMSILKEFSPNVEVYSIDEAFVDLTGLSRLYNMNYYKMAQYIRNLILEKTKIPVSIGISRTKPLAKLASDKSKNFKSHICITGKCGISKLLKQSEISEIWGIGRKLGPKLKSFGIYTAFDYVQKNDVWLKSRFGKNGLELKYELLGSLINKVSNKIDMPKSISDTKSFSEFSSDLNFLKNELQIHIHSACRKLRNAGGKATIAGIILKTKDFKVFFEKINLAHQTNFEFEISREVFPLLDKMFNSKIIYRSIGIYLAGIEPEEKQQLQLFGDSIKREKNEKLAKSIDKLEEKFGRNIVKPGFINDVPIKQDFLTK